MIENALFIVPHPDDELNIGGPFLIDLSGIGTNIYILYTTNGDSSNNYDNKRILQAYNACVKLGIPKRNVSFLGYPDGGYKSEKHIYNCEDHRALVGNNGKTLTNCLEGENEYCFINEGCHHLFTRNNLKCDLKAYISSLMPDLIVSVDFDSHVDHRCASLLFDEVMGEILKEKIRYRPIVFKKFAYDGVWCGEKDYYGKYRKMTLSRGRYKYSGNNHELPSPCFYWEDRLQFTVSEKNKTSFLSNTLLYKAAICHKSTDAYYCIQKIVNDDYVCWQRNTNNLMLNADITSSSGITEYLNDFKLYDSADINDIDEPFSSDYKGYWIPSQFDENPEIYIQFTNSEYIKLIKIYRSCNNYYKRCNVKLIMDEEIIYDGTLSEEKTLTIIELESKCSNQIKLVFYNFDVPPVIGEIEIYSEKNKFDYSVIGIDKYNGESINYKFKCNDKLMILIKYFFQNKMYEIYRKIRGKLYVKR